MIRFILRALLVIESGLLSASAQTFFYDDAGRLLRVAYPQGSGIAYTYDATDNLTSVRAISLPVAPMSLSVNRLSPNSARLTWQDASGNETGFIVMRKLLGTNQWQLIATLGPGVTGFTDSSLNPSLHYVYRVAAQGDSGLSAYSNEESSAANASIEMRLTPGGSSATSTIGSTGATQAGYATVTVDSGTDPYGTAVFSLTQNGNIVSEVGVPASPPTKSARIFIDYRTGVRSGSGVLDIYTGFAVVNRGNGKANINYTLRDLAGRTLAAGNGTLELDAHFAKFIDQIKDVAPNFDLPSNFPTATRFGSLEFTSDQPLSILALRLTTNQRGETLLTSTPIADLEQARSTAALYFPQFVDGGGYVTSLVLMNTSNASENGTIDVFGGTGAPLSVRSSTGASGSSFTYAIPPGGSFVIETDGSPASANAGWVRLTPDPGTSTPVAAGVFRFTQEGVAVTESGIPSASLTTKARIYIDKSSGHDTGLAVVNPGSSQMNVTLKAFETDGTTAAGNGTAGLPLRVRGHSARFVGQLISGLPAGFTGVLEISAPAPFAALTLRSLTNGRGDFLLTTFPIADVNGPAPVPIVFPQIADGGGFVTQFILISPAGAASTVINFFDDNGAPLPVAKK